MRIQAQANRRRSGTTAVEFAFVSLPLMLFVIGLIVGGLGIFRYQEVAWLARLGARYASVHGTHYAQVTASTPATATDVYNNAILPNAIALDTTQLSATTTWNPYPTPGSTVTVTVVYNWLPEAFLGGITLSSTSTMTVAY
jgi:Flp pilus assembly protein TadG